jgi:hypothetical protein
MMFMSSHMWEEKSCNEKLNILYLLFFLFCMYSNVRKCNLFVVGLCPS